MIKTILFCLLIFPMLSQAMPINQQPQVLQKSQQLILVITNSWGAHKGLLQRFYRTKIKSPWQATSPAFTVLVGKKGLGWGVNMHKYNLPGPDKKEGDNKAPAGVFPLGITFGFAKMPPASQKAPYMQIKNTTVCVDNPQSPYYNQIIDITNHKKSSWKSGERMRSTPTYMNGLVVNYNEKKSIKGAGSCIFMHAWDHELFGTSGCTAMPKSKIKVINAWINPQDHPVLVQLPKSAYVKLKKVWRLPSLSTN